MTFNNPIFDELIDLNLISKENLKKISSKTRDSNISVYKDNKEEIIFLQKYSTNNSYYKNTKYEYKNKNLISQKKNKKIKISTNNGLLSTPPLNDDARRYETLNNFFKNKDILDYGCGWGGFVSYLKNSKSVCGIEIKDECLKHLNKTFPEFRVETSLEEYDKQFDIITLFHVLEHIPHQVKTLSKLKSKLRNNGKLIVEVPSAHDFLLKFENLKGYKDFTFFSEHLILHTEKSLRSILKNSGFNNIDIQYYQRYDMSNHLGWFIEEKPGGHEFFNHITDNKINDEYKNFLVRNKTSDTLIAIAS